jgi:PBP1b-binding outer membrane lipoprotein LpoB
MKKILFTILLSIILLTSCGKKSDPYYKEAKIYLINSKIL